MLHFCLFSWLLLECVAFKELEQRCLFYLLGLYFSFWKSDEQTAVVRWPTFLICYHSALNQNHRNWYYVMLHCEAISCLLRGESEALLSVTAEVTQITRGANNQRAWIILEVCPEPFWFRFFFWELKLLVSDCHNTWLLLQVCVCERLWPVIIV